jgi:5-methyltetrahydrofolate--homocysteine methyltransferase
MPGLDEKETMKSAVELFEPVCDAPLCLDSSSPEVIEAALWIYPAGPSSTRTRRRGSQLERLSARRREKRGHVHPASPERRGEPRKGGGPPAVVERSLKRPGNTATKEDIVVDGLVMTVSSSAGRPPKP